MVFPGQLNYHCAHAGWQFVGLDTTQGTDFADTLIGKDNWDNILNGKAGACAAHLSKAMHSGMAK